MVLSGIIIILLILAFTAIAVLEDIWEGSEYINGNQ